MSGCSRRRSSSRRRRSAVSARACSCPTPSKASARGCSGSTASRRSSNERKEIDEHHCKEGEAATRQIHSRGESRNEGARPRVEGGRGWRKCGARRAGRDVAEGSRSRQADSLDLQGKPSYALAVERSAYVGDVERILQGSWLCALGGV